MSSRILTFSEGMYENVKPEFLKDTQAVDVVNMKPEGVGKWGAVRTLKAHGTAIFETNLLRCIEWTASNYYNYSGSYLAKSKTYYVALKSNGPLCLYYKDKDDVWTSVTLATLTSYSRDTFRYALSPNQFIFVTGYANDNAQRITIDQSGTLTLDRIGMKPSGKIGTVHSITLTEEESDTGMIIPAGVAMQYVSCDVNKFGEISNPTAIITTSEAMGLTQGQINDVTGEFIDTGVLYGSQRNCNLTINTQPNAEKTYLYRRWIPFSEGDVPITDFNLVQINTLTKSLKDVSSAITITDGSPASNITASYDNAQLQSANDVVMLPENITVFGNASNKTMFHETPDDTWEITINNRNSSNYVDVLITLDLFDTAKGSSQYFEGLNWTTEDIANLRFVFNDRVTCMPFYYYDTDAQALFQKDNMDAITVNTRKMVCVKIPYLPAYTETVIYLCRKDAGWSGTDWNDYGGVAYDSGSFSPTIDNTDFYPLSRPRSRDTLISTRNYTNPLCRNVRRNQNLASSLFTASAALEDYSSTVNLFDPIRNKNRETLIHGLAGYTAASSGDGYWFDYSSNDMKMPDKGMASFWLDMKSYTGTGDSIPIITLGYGDADPTDHPYIYVKCKTQDTPNSYTFTIGYHTHDTGDVDTAADFAFTDDVNHSYSPQFFVFISWESIREGAGEANGYTHIRLWVIGNDSGVVSSYYQQNTAINLPDILFAGSPNEFHLVMGAYNQTILFSNLNFEKDRYIGDTPDYIAARVYNLASMRYDFDNEPVGIVYGDEDLHFDSTYYWFTNKNVTIKLLENDQDIGDGLVKFGSNNSVSDLNTIQLNDTILRIIYDPLATSSGGINTVYAFSKRGVYNIQIAQNKATWTSIESLKNCGLKYASALARYENTIIWQSHDGLVTMNNGVIDKPFIQRMARTTIDTISWCWGNKWLYMIDNANDVVYVYSPYYNVMFRLLTVSSSYYSLTSIVETAADGTPFYITSANNGYVEHDSSLVGTRYIKSGYMPGRPRMNRLMSNRVLAVTPTFYDGAISGGYTVGTVMNLTANQKQSYPGTKADWIQLSIAGTNFDYLITEFMEK